MTSIVLLSSSSYKANSTVLVPIHNQVPQGSNSKLEDHKLHRTLLFKFHRSVFRLPGLLAPTADLPPESRSDVYASALAWLTVGGCVWAPALRDPANRKCDLLHIPGLGFPQFPRCLVVERDS